jgi:hypothetical protein
MNNNFIKIADPNVAEQLARLGFQYIKESNVFVFTECEEILALLSQTFKHTCFVTENKLRF